MIPILGQQPSASASSTLVATVTSLPAVGVNGGLPIGITIDGSATAVNCECVGFNVVVGTRVYVQRVQNRLFVVGVAPGNGIGNRPVALTITDWNTAVFTGDYQSAPSAGSNAPDTTSWWLGHSYTHDPQWIVQVVYAFTDAMPMRRAERRGTPSGTVIAWDAWRIYDRPVYDYYEEFLFSAQVIATGGSPVTLANLTLYSPNKNQNKLGGTPMNLTTGQWTCPLAGSYTLSMTAGTGAASSRTEAIILNSTQARRLASIDATSQNALAVSCTRWINLNDVIVFQYFQASGASATIATAAISNSSCSIFLNSGRD